MHCVRKVSNISENFSFISCDCFIMNFLKYSINLLVIAQRKWKILNLMQSCLNLSGCIPKWDIPKFFSSIQSICFFNYMKDLLFWFFCLSIFLLIYYNIEFAHHEILFCIMIHIIDNTFSSLTFAYWKWIKLSIE